MRLQIFSNCINIVTIDKTYARTQLLDVYFVPRVMNGEIVEPLLEYLYQESLTEDIISEPRFFPNPIVDCLFIQKDNTIEGIFSVFNMQGSLVHQ